MSFAQTVRGAAESIAQGGDPREVASDALRKTSEGFGIDPNDFLEVRDRAPSIATRIEEQTASLANADEAINHSKRERSRHGPVQVVAPVVIPRSRTAAAVLPVLLLAGAGVVGLLATGVVYGVVANPFFGIHYWILVLLTFGFLWWRQGLVRVPEGCAALITKFGRLEHVAPPGRITLYDPRKKVGYIVNTSREFPYNAPIREAPTKGGVKASVDLFVQFRIEDPEQFIFVLGGVQGLREKLDNAISETTRSLIYEQEASNIYDLVGESTRGLLDQLNRQFLPAVRLTNANITHAEPSSQEYRMDLAATEMVRVAKEAYTYEYELNLLKEQNEGVLNRELASLNETLSSIQADIAQYQAQMDTALERETNRARAVARQRFVEAESTAHANAALLEAQALDIRAVAAAEAPEILNYRYQQDLLDKLESVAASLPQVIQVGGHSAAVNFLETAQQIIGISEGELFSQQDMSAIRMRLAEIQERINSRESEIEDLLNTEQESTVDTPDLEELEEVPGADMVEELRQSVSTESVEERIAEQRTSETQRSVAPSEPSAAHTPPETPAPSAEPGAPPSGQPYGGPPPATGVFPPDQPWGTYEGGQR
ncbi:SPFH domain-containing protein [Spiractinospora alimapuensis]|uniref:SPFH domain-containing protein n=1 Tax=Spiractinospora alimapuensis TaxID=2820884 RepID=UPI001EFF13C2|nr:SPFH domain-containing protein [Spiractinospora alimapuensis]QVQ51992.1 SPFH domain-containing protein [Spiractinospora alimapuensis]